MVKWVNYNIRKCWKCGRKDTYIRPEGGQVWHKRYIKGFWTNEWTCNRCNSKEYYQSIKLEISEQRKSFRDRRAGNLSDHTKVFSDDCEELTCQIFGVDNLNKKNDNYKSQIDHSKHEKLGILQTKGSTYNEFYERWTLDTEDENKDFDNLIIWCANKDRSKIERLYIIPKKDAIKTKRIGITISINSLKNVWYEQYRIIDEELLKKINDIWLILNGNDW